MKSPRFINNYKLKNVLCDSEGVPIDSLKVGEQYEVTHFENEVKDDEGNVIMKITEIEIGENKARIMPDAFNDFFETVDGEEL